MKTIKVARTASDGIAAARAYVYEGNSFIVPETLIQDGDTDTELFKFEEARKKIMGDLAVLADEEEIFKAHLALADDVTFVNGVQDKIRNNHFNVQLAVHKTAEEIVSIFDMMSDEYMKERAADIKDIERRYLACLQGKKLIGFEGICEPVIIVAKELYPSDTASLDLNYIKGFITEDGGVTSHVSIIAKEIGLPALVGVSAILSQIKNGDLICMNAQEGMIVIEPDERTLRMYQDAGKLYQENHV